MGSLKDPGDTLAPNEFETMADYSPMAGATGRTGFGVVVMPLPIYPIVLAQGCRRQGQGSGPGSALTPAM